MFSVPRNPPPPSLSAVIIQMDPNASVYTAKRPAPLASPSPTIPTASEITSSSRNAPNDQPRQRGTKKPKTQKQTSKSSRKDAHSKQLEEKRRAHRTAHSMIERRRRIKMNNEFEALKHLVPACRRLLSKPTVDGSNGGSASGSAPTRERGNSETGIYKLAILQASVEYIQYLHQCLRSVREFCGPEGAEWNFDFVDEGEASLAASSYNKHPDLQEVTQSAELPKADAEAASDTDSGQSSPLFSSPEMSSSDGYSASGRMPVVGLFRYNRRSNVAQQPSPGISPTDISVGCPLPVSEMALPAPAVRPEASLEKEMESAGEALLMLKKTSISSILN